MKKVNYISVALVLGILFLFCSHVIAGPNENAGIRFDLDAITYGNQNQTSIAPPSVGAFIRLDVYAINVHNLDTYEFEVNYNPNQIEYITTTSTNPITYEENILTSNGGEALGPLIDTSTPGVLSISMTLTGTDTTEAPEGEGLVADIVFQVLSTIGDSLTFGDVYFYDSFGVMDIITDTNTATFLPYPPDNVNIEIVAAGDSVRISWNNESYTYHVYSSDDPYAAFPDEWGPPVSTVINTGEVILPVPEDNKKFYCVTANNAK